MKPPSPPDQDFARALLDGLREEHEPPAGAAPLGLAAVRARIDRGELGSEPPPIDGPAVHAGAIAAAGVTAAAVIATAWLGWGAEPIPNEPPAVPVDVEPPAKLEIPVVPQAQPAPDRPAAYEVEPEVRSIPRRSARARMEPTEPPPSPAGVEAELALVSPARRALATGEPKAALALLAEHAARFPTGFLAEEREVLRITALCGAGSVPEALALRREFLAARPRSRYVGRVSGLCSDGGEPTRTNGSEDP